ncbi:MAG: hypothetical protein JRM98_05070 [Nitrososphaerota archaeon]|nr:hypothetical protein [Nitrososphaerota archaeon]
MYSAKESPNREGWLKHFEQTCFTVQKVDKHYADRLRGSAENFPAFLDY